MQRLSILNSLDTAFVTSVGTCYSASPIRHGGLANITVHVQCVPPRSAVLVTEHRNYVYTCLIENVPM